nr:DNA cytosine methyltransferase [Paeniglutamicibacter gangotriensis]
MMVLGHHHSPDPWNRPDWDVHQGDVREISGRGYNGVDLLAGGVPCPPISIAGKQLGADDERDLFPKRSALSSKRHLQPYYSKT